MEHHPISIRPFIGAIDFKISRDFYRDFGFQELIINPKLSYFKRDHIGFYLQDASIKDWIDNTMIFMEVKDLDVFWTELKALNLPEKYQSVRIIPIQNKEWGRECFVYDPSGILWHIGSFY
ncbi:glyoxalase [Dyadobacter tibetensis]|uniref:glyoxalase n=1 Tax=Dyadobacter tibetensis TaxID=1211851 RepID=UPI00046E7731|nr:glyoxalase [Dyadobacter tibetensis]